MHLAFPGIPESIGPHAFTGSFSSRHFLFFFLLSSDGAVCVECVRVIVGTCSPRVPAIDFVDGGGGKAELLSNANTESNITCNVAKMRNVCSDEI